MRGPWWQHGQTVLLAGEDGCGCRSPSSLKAQGANFLIHLSRCVALLGVGSGCSFKICFGSGIPYDRVRKSLLTMFQAGCSSDGTSGPLRLAPDVSPREWFTGSLISTFPSLWSKDWRLILCVILAHWMGRSILWSLSLAIRLGWSGLFSDGLMQ